MPTNFFVSPVLHFVTLCEFSQRSYRHFKVELVTPTVCQKLLFRDWFRFIRWLRVSLCPRKNIILHVQILDWIYGPSLTTFRLWVFSNWIKLESWCKYKKLLRIFQIFNFYIKSSFWNFDNPFELLKIRKLFVRSVSTQPEFGFKIYYDINPTSIRIRTLILMIRSNLTWI